MNRRRLHAALAVALWVLTGCTPPPAEPPPALLAGAAASPVACRIGPADGRPETHDAGIVAGSYAVADRGIGGTGGGTGPLPPVMPAAPPRPTAPVDRGIGGTGPGAAEGPATTGIVGVITGFASVCVNGIEVGYGAGTRFADDAGGVVDADGLRAGQLAVVTAGSRAGSLEARSVALRHEVVGPVDLVAADGMIEVAGQSVRLSGQTRGGAVAAGSWVAVSGLRDPDDVIVATRIDPAPEGIVFVRGQLSGAGDAARIGQLRLRVSRSLALPPNGAVTASGRLLDGVLHVTAIAADPAAADPSAAFDPEVTDFVVESRSDLGIGFGPDADFARGEVFVVQLQRRPGGALRSVALRRGGFGYAALAAGVPAATGPLYHLRATTGSIGAATLPARRDEPAPIPRGIARGRDGFGGRGGPGGHRPGRGPRRGGPQNWGPQGPSGGNGGPSGTPPGH